MGISCRTAATSKERRSNSGMTPPLHAVESFLVILVDPNHYGRIFVEVSSPPTALVPFNLSQSSVKGAGRTGQPLTATSTPFAAPSPTVILKYQLLNPEDAFKDVVEDARAVILAGGTMTPVRLPLSHCPVLFPNTNLDCRCPTSHHNSFPRCRLQRSRPFRVDTSSQKRTYRHWC